MARKIEVDTPTEKKKSPFLVHWVTGPVPCCRKHALALMGLAKTMGFSVPVSENPPPSLTCPNCENEKGEGESDG